MDKPLNQTPNAEPWYAVRCLFYHDDKQVYEERTVVIRANSVDEAIEKAEFEASQYCQDLGTVRYLDYLDTYHLFDDQLTDGTEVFSLMRSLDISPDEYVDRFLDSGTERRTPLQ